MRKAVKANNTVDRRAAGARIEEIILEEDEGHIEDFDEGVPHPEEQQDWEDQPEEDDQQYCFNVGLLMGSICKFSHNEVPIIASHEQPYFNDDEYEMRSIDNDIVHVNVAIKASGYNDHCRLYGIRVQEAETDLRVSEVVQTGSARDPYYTPSYKSP
ncbi:hypothetical protein M422DRAFT_262817 [Sphaerobolus stellatus SS14]|uniref:Uncharacterized protein n=1 Tax=Sphaerobolus stellatus (strain SS14) TaxID=990650 RepID=A0A0C9VCJ6_SPHS4|nr:hypothetical protein M422DRAFT_262817 [Sphaerobolus stellatus SS14]